MLLISAFSLGEWALGFEGHGYAYDSCFGMLTYRDYTKEWKEDERTQDRS